MNNIVLRDQIVKKLSKDLLISQTRSKAMVGALESIIAHELKVKSRIKIAHFGTFVVKTRASRTVKTVREQKTKIILQQEVIRFIASNQFKNQLIGKVSAGKPESAEPVKVTEKKVDQESEKISVTSTKPEWSTHINTKDNSERISINFQSHEKRTQINRIPLQQTSEPSKTKTTKIIAIQDSTTAEQTTTQATVSKFKCATQVPLKPKSQINKAIRPAKEIIFSPLSIYSRIERAKIESEITNRLIKLARSLKSQTTNPELAQSANNDRAHERIFASFIAQAINLKVRSLDFSLSKTRPTETDSTLLCAGRPRICLGKIPTLLLHQFILEVADIDDFKTPQLRFVTIKKPDNMKKVALEIHSFPTYQGASIHISIL